MQSWSLTIQPRISAIICTYDRYHVLTGAIGSLLAQTLQAGEIEIIIIDNSPDQAAAAAFGARYAGISNLRYVLEPRPGLSNARNAAVALAKADIVGFIDDDAVAEPGWAAGIVAAFAAFGPVAGAAGGPARPLWLSPRPAWLSDDLLGHISIVDHGPSLRVLPAGRMLMGCNMAFDKNLLVNLGGFNRQLGRNGPELSLLSNGEPGVLNAVRAAGREIVYAPHAGVQHKIDASRLSQTWFRRRAAWQAVSDYLLDPKAAAGLAPDAARYLRMVENSQARPRAVGFFGPVENSADFAGEMLLIRQLMLATLGGGAEIEPRPSGQPTRLDVKLRALLLLRLHRKLRRSPLAISLAQPARRFLASLRQSIGVRR